MVWTVLIILWVFCGIFGAIIAANRKASTGLGFFLGLFFGPIGLIIAALLSPEHAPEVKSQAPTAPPASLAVPEERELSNDAYKIYLRRAYKIERDEILSAFICENKLFDSLEEVLLYAHEKDLEKERIKFDSELEIIKKRNEYEAAKKISDELKIKSDQKLGIYVAIFSIIFFTALILYSINVGKKQRIESEEKYRNILSEFSDWGISAYPNSTHHKMSKVSESIDEGYYQTCNENFGTLIEFYSKDEPLDIIAYYNANHEKSKINVDSPNLDYDNSKFADIEFIDTSEKSYAVRIIAEDEGGLSKVHICKHAIS